MEIWYRTGGYGKDLIEPVNVVKATEKTVTILRPAGWNGKPKEDRSAINSSYHNHFRTWDEAQAYLIAKSQGRIESLRRQLEVEKSHLGNIRSLKKPEND